MLGELLGELGFELRVFACIIISVPRPSRSYLACTQGLTIQLGGHVIELGRGVINLATVLNPDFPLDAPALLLVC